MSRILILLENRENQRLLADLLRPRHAVLPETSSSLDEPFDLCLLDGPHLSRLREAIQRRKAAEHPLFLPFLLITLRQDLGIATGSLWQAVDDLLILPLNKIELMARVEILLRARNQSLELKRLHEQRERAVKQELEAMRSLDRLKSNFVNSVTHELRTPVTTIRGYAEFLEDEVAGPLGEEQANFVKQIQLASVRLERLITDLLDFARIDAGTFQLQARPADLGAAVAEVLASVKPQAEAAHLRLAGVTPDSLIVVMDRARIMQALSNLVTNAIKFTPAGGTIRVRVLDLDHEVRCEVSDTGEGITSDEIPRLFQRFAQLEAGTRKGGTGLGLSISKAIIEAHGGHIGVTSERGVGSTFWFTLPKTAPPPTLASEQRAEPPP